MYDEKGQLTWEARLDMYGKVANFAGSSLNDCPFRYQGQYEDSETGLYYNRFRYYDSSTGNYLSQDPIRLTGDNPTLYGYVHNPNSWIDVFGLMLINPNSVFFSQNSIRKNFSNGTPVQDVTEAISANPKIAQNFDEPIRLMKLENLPDNVQEKLISQGAQKGDIFSLDNRRLYAAQQGGADAINARFVTQADLNAEAKLNGEFPINLNKRFSTENAGRSIEVRCG
jgi:RHS repeat-associated protein